MRLRATKTTFNGRVQTTFHLLEKTNAQIVVDYRQLNALRGRIVRSTRPQTLEKIRSDLHDLAQSMGHATPTKSSKNYLLNKINVYKKQNSFLLYAAVQQSIINICVIYEDFVKRIILKYYEEDIRRVPSGKEALKNHQLIDAILRGDNIHRTLAEKTVDDLMYGSVETWHDTLVKQKMNLITSRSITELFLIRNCIVHNNNRVSSQLHQFDSTKYSLRGQLVIDIRDVEKHKDEVHKTAVYIMSEFNRLHPINRGTWL